ncbi:YraN family protein [Treponema sp. TIM-1]|uniref:YraN family protein n=1 Tax=Treponema sp. TIM-1 TaxID=2898417 RepID=UPI00397EBCFB
MNRSGAGREGEEKAAAALEKSGMSIIARNVRFKTGEIDLVALDGDKMVFVEVKSWTAYGFEELRFGIDKKKQRRIIETAKFFLAAHREYNCMAVRFDVVFIGPETVTHLISAFMEQE